MRTREYLDEIRESEGFPRAILSKITVDKANGVVTFQLVTDVTYTESDAAYAKNISAKYVPDGMRAEVRISKLIADERAVRDKILTLLGAYSPVAASFIRPEDVEVIKDGVNARFCLDVTAEEKSMLHTGELVDSLAQGLCRSFCGGFTGTVRETEKGENFSEEDLRPVDSDDTEETEFLPARLFPIVNFESIDGGDKPKTAVCMADCNEESDDLTICGEILNIAEKQTGKGKPFFTIFLSDGTGRLRVTYFSKQSSVEKIRALKVGDKIVCSGANESFNGSLSYHAKRINRGTMPENYAIEERPMKKVPAAYHTVFPEPLQDYRQTDLFTEEYLPPALTQRDFVVFDLETTGLNNTATGGVMDSIIEVGAVKIRGGKICEKFSTFVAYDKKLPPNIVELTGITDDMLVGAPTIKRVIPDFYKFCDGCALVGHNVNFDYRFIEYYANRERYSFARDTYDTLTLAQELLRLPNYKLNTLADYYGFTFNHHRAYEDAFTTAKIFTELVKQRKTLP